MQVAVETLSGLSRKIKVTVPADQIDNEVMTRLKQQANRVKLKGFRPGKVPFHIVEQQFGDAVRQEVVGDIIRSSFYEAVNQEKLVPAGFPNIQPKAMQPGKPLEYEAVFEIYPEIKFNDLKAIKIEKLTAEVTEQDIDKVLEKLQRQQAQWQEVSRPAQLEDRIIIDFTGSINGEKFAGGAAKEVPLILGSKSMIPGFEDQLIACKAGQELEIKVEFPKEYPHKELADKPAVFAIKVHKVEAAKLPELNDEFARNLDVTDGGINALRKEVRVNMEKELERAAKELVKRQMFKQLIEANPIEVPAALVDREIQAMQQQFKQQMSMQTGKKNLPDMPKEAFAEEAKRRVALGLLMSECIKQHDLKADPDRVRSIIDEMSANYDHPEQVIAYYYQNQEHLAQIESLVLEEQAVAKLLEQVQVEEKSTTYDEIVNPKQTNKDINHE